MRLCLDKLETQVVIEARRRGMDWRQVAHHQGLNSSQAACQRYQRLASSISSDSVSPRVSTTVDDQPSSDCSREMTAVP
jgi:hypothetical protein